MKRWLFLATLCIFLISAVSAFPFSSHLNIQTTDASGNIQTGTSTFDFNYSTNSACTAVVYTNRQTLTTDARGIINYTLPLTNALNYSDDYYFCVYRDGVLKSNEPFSTVPYAYRARNVSWEGVENKPLINGTFNQSLTDSIYFNLSGSNARQNINVSNATQNFNVTAGTFFGSAAGLNDACLLNRSNCNETLLHTDGSNQIRANTNITAATYLLFQGTGPNNWGGLQWISGGAMIGQIRFGTGAFRINGNGSMAFDQLSSGQTIFNSLGPINLIDVNTSFYSKIGTALFIEGSYGNIGINNSAPNATLHVQGNVLVSNNITVQGNISALNLCYGNGLNSTGGNCSTATSSGGSFTTNQDNNNLNKSANITYNGLNLTDYLNIGNVGNTSNSLTILSTGTASVSNIGNTEFELRNVTGSPVIQMQSNGKFCLGQGQIQPCTSNAFALQISGESATGIRVNVASGTASVAGNFQFLRSRGNLTTPTANSQNDVAFGIQSGAFDGTAFRLNYLFQAFVDGPVATNQVPMGGTISLGNGTNNMRKMEWHSNAPTISNESLTINGQRYNANVLELFGYENIDTTPTFSGLLVNGSIFDACTNGNCNSGSPSYRGVFYIDANGSYIPQNNVTSDIGSGVNRIRKIWAQNITAVNITTGDLIFSNNMKITEPTANSLRFHNSSGSQIIDIDRNAIITNQVVNLTQGAMLATIGSQPSCSVSNRGQLWVIQGGAGVADLMEVCAKTVLDSYSWRIVGLT